MTDIQSLNDLVFDDRNANKGSPRGSAMLETSLREYGAGRSILLDRNGKIIAGNKTVESASSIGLEDVLVVQTDGTQIVAVQRMDLDMDADPRARALALFDNRVQELSLTWDTDVLASLGEEIDLEPFWSRDELAGLLEETLPEAGAGGDEFDATPQDGPTRVQPGELWRLGRHRLLCGDSTKREDVERLMGGEVPVLMVTDPPYGVEYDSEWRKPYSSGNYSVGSIANDDRADWSEVWELWNVPVLYVWHGGLHAHVVATSLISTGYELRGQIIWNKSVMVFGRGHYHWKHEPCWYAVKKGATANWHGDRKQTTVWDWGNGSGAGRTGDTADEFHAGHISQKPLELFRIPIENHTVTGDVCAEPFAGSGSQFIACERAGRRCFGMEIDPKYCDVIIKRYETETNDTATRID